MGRHPGRPWAVRQGRRRAQRRTRSRLDHRAAWSGDMTLTEIVPSTNGHSSQGGATAGSTYETLRLAVLDEIAQSSIDSRDRHAVEDLVRAHLDRYQRSAESGGARRFSNPTEVTGRLVRSVAGAGPFEKFFVTPDLADEVSFKRDVITYFTREGRQVIDSEPTSEAELLAVCQRLLADAGVA